MRIFRDEDATAAAAANGADGRAGLDRANLAAVKSIIAVASAKGGVGKSAVTVNLAAVLALAGRKVGIVDADLNSPAVMPMLGMKVPRRPGSLTPLDPGAGPLGLRIVASSMLADGEPPPISFLDDEPAVTAAPVTAAHNGHAPVQLSYEWTLRRLVGETHFGALDLVLVDLAPGLDQLYRMLRLLPLTGTIMISQSSEIAVRATRGALELTAACAAPVLGIVENMAGFSCDGCHAARPLMPQGDLASAAQAAGVAILARFPFDARLAECCDRGLLFVREYGETPLARQFVALGNTLAGALGLTSTTTALSA